MVKSKVKEVNYLLNKVSDKEPGTNTPKFCMLIGAGCSFESGLPLGGDVITLLQHEVFINEKCSRPPSLKPNKKWKEYLVELQKFVKTNKLEKAFEDFIDTVESQVSSETDADFEKYLDRLPYSLFSKDKRQKLKDADLKNLWNLHKDKIYKDLMYGAWFELYDDKASERQHYIEQLMDNTDAQAGYIFMANIVKNDYLRTVFTTNFDDLVYDALMRIAGTRARVFAHQELSGYIDFRKTKPSIVKLHGDYLFQDIRNTITEIDVQGNRMHGKLHDSISQFNLIVCGYNGADYSIMRILEEAKIYNQTSPFELIWCSPSPFEKLHWRVKELLKNYNNSWFIQIGFDELMAKTEAHLNLPVIKLQEQAKTLEDKINSDRDRYLNKAKEEKKLDDSDVNILKMKNEIYVEKDIDKKLLKYKAYLNQMPEDGDVWNDYGSEYYTMASNEKTDKKRDFLNEAAHCFKNAIGGGCFFGWRNYAITYAEMSIHLKAEADILALTEKIFEEACLKSKEDRMLSTCAGFYFEISFHLNEQDRKKFLKKAVEKFSEACKKPEFNSWDDYGRCYSNLAKLANNKRDSKEYFLNAEQMYKKAIEADDQEAFDNYAGILLKIYHLEEDISLKNNRLEQALALSIKGNKISENHCAYNLACVYSLKGERELAYTWIEIALKQKSIPNREHIENDIDFKLLKNDSRFISLLDNYRPIVLAGKSEISV